MPEPRSTRRKALALGLIAPASALGAAAPVDEAARAAIRAAGEAKIKAAREILAFSREALLAPPRAGGDPSRSEVLEQIQGWSRALADARLEIASGRDEPLAILAEEVARARDHAREVADRIREEGFGLSGVHLARAEFYRAAAEMRLAREKATA